MKNVQHCVSFSFYLNALTLPKNILPNCKKRRVLAILMKSFVHVVLNFCFVENKVLFNLKFTGQIKVFTYVKLLQKNHKLSNHKLINLLKNLYLVECIRLQ